MPIITLDPTHASAAARLHIAGQPNTFLTSLGPEVLTTFYRALPQSPTGFGFTALADTVADTTVQQSKIQNLSWQDPKSKMIVGFISATTSTGQLFLQLGTRYLPAFLPPLLRRFAQRPGLLLHCMQTVFYPLLQRAHAGKGADGAAPLPTAELLSIMVEPAWRSQGVGAQLLDSLVAECRARKLGALDVTVAADNAGAQRFYARHGFVEQHRFTLYGRPMVSYRKHLTLRA
jgi:ribosomal protein S18 acetylase RimI-like enzyme